MESILLLLALSTCVEQPSQCSTSSTANTTVISACGLLPKGKGTNGTGANGGDPIELRGRVNGEDYIVILSEQCEVI